MSLVAGVGLKHRQTKATNQLEKTRIGGGGGDGGKNIYATMP